MIASSTPDLAQSALRLKRQERIRFISRVLAHFCTVVSIVLLAGLGAYWILAADDTLLLDAHLTGIALRPVGWTVRFASLLISVLPLACLIWGLLRARRCFLSFVQGHFFTVENVAHLRDLAVAVLASTLLKLVAGAVLSVVLSWQTYAHGKTLVINFDSDSLLALLFAGLLSVTGWVMAEANAIAEEHAQFV